MNKRHLTSRRRMYSRSRHDFGTRHVPAPRPERPDLAIDLLGAVGASRDEGAQPEAPVAFPVASTADVPSPRTAGDPPATPRAGSGGAGPQVPAPSAAASRRDALPFAVALAARPALLPAGPPGGLDPG